MSPHASGADSMAPADAASLALRFAQRALAANLDNRDAGELATARLRSNARRTLSALSADDRGRFVDGLALVIATHGAPMRERTIGVIGRVDRGGVAHVGRARRARVDALAMRAGAANAVVVASSARRAR